MLRGVKTAADLLTWFKYLNVGIFSVEARSR